MTARPVAALTADNLTLDVPQVGDTYLMPRDLLLSGNFSLSLGTFSSGVVDGASAVAYSYDTDAAYSTAGSKLASWKNNTVEKAYIDKDGALRLNTSVSTSNGLVLHISSPAQANAFTIDEDGDISASGTFNSASGTSTFGQMSANTDGALSTNLNTTFYKNFINTGRTTSLFTIQGGTRSADLAPGALAFTGGAALPAATTNIVGSNVNIAGGAGASSSAGAANGGHVYLDGGQGYGTGAHGDVVVGNTRGNLVVGATSSIKSAVADGATAVGFDFSTDNVYSTAGANLVRFGNSTTPVFGFSFQGGINHANSGATTAAHSQSLNLNFVSSSTRTSSGLYSAVIGSGNTASGDLSLCVGTTNVASGSAAIAFGSNNNVSGSYSAAIGERGLVSQWYSLAVGYKANVVHATTLGIGGYAFSTEGDKQVQTSVMGIATTNATQTTLKVGNGSNMTISADTAWAFSALIVARSDEADGNNCATYKIEGGLKRDESNNTALVGTPTVTVIAEDTDAIPWSVDAVADDTGEALAIRVTGEAATNIRWVAKVDIAQVIYA